MFNWIVSIQRGNTHGVYAFFCAVNAYCLKRLHHITMRVISILKFKLSLLTRCLPNLQYSILVPAVAM